MRRTEFLGLLYGNASYDGSILYVHGIHSITYGNASYGIERLAEVDECILRTEHCVQECEMMLSLDLYRGAA